MSVRPLDGHAGRRAIQADGGEPGRGLPVTVRATGVDALAPPGTSTQAGQVGFRPRFVEEDQACGVKAGLLPPPRPTCPRELRAVLFAGAECLFLYVSPSFAKV